MEFESTVYSLTALCQDRPAQASTEIFAGVENPGPSPDLHGQNLHSDEAYQSRVQPRRVELKLLLSER